MFFDTSGTAGINATFVPRVISATRTPSTYVANPPPNCTAGSTSNIKQQRDHSTHTLAMTSTICEQRLLAGGSFATAILHQSSSVHTGTTETIGTTEDLQTGMIVVSVANSVPGGVPVGRSAHDLAVTAMESAAAAGWEAVHTTHTQWWHSYWGQSMVSVPDAMVESFLLLQLYKAGSAMRCDNQTCWVWCT